MTSTKILYDWAEHGRNRAKKEKDEYDKDLAKTCRECGEEDSQFHIITECITGKLTNIRIETDARIDLYIQEVAQRGECIDFHECIREIVQRSTRTEKLRLGMWELRDAEKVASIDIVKKASEMEVNKLRTELENMNAIYYMGCRKLIREKQKMDWIDRNPNTIGRRRKKKNSKTYQRETMFNSKVRSVNEVLKDSKDINEAEVRKRSNRSKSKRKLEIKKSRSNTNEAEDISVNTSINTPKRRKCNSEKIEKKVVGKRHRSEGNGEKVIGTKIKRKETTRGVPNKEKDKDRLKRKKPSEYYIQQSIMEITDREKKGEDKEKKRKRKRRYDLTTSNSEASLKKSRRTKTEDIRVFFGTEDSH